MVTVNKARRKGKTALKDNLKKLYYLAEKRSFIWNAQLLSTQAISVWVTIFVELALWKLSAQTFQSPEDRWLHWNASIGLGRIQLNRENISSASVTEFKILKYLWF